ncbi:helix-turn-helix domain-containing protein [Leucobacter sp. HY1910]
MRPTQRAKDATDDFASVVPRTAIEVEKTEESGNFIERIGRAIHQARHTRGLSVEALAKQAGISIGSLSQLERGIGNPSVMLLKRLADALSVSLARLIDVSTPPARVVRVDQRQPAQGVTSHDIVDGERYTYLAEGEDHFLTAVWMETQPGHSTEHSPYSHPGEEFGIVLRGRKEVHVGDICYELGPGDSIIFASSQPHWYRNISDEPVVSIWVTTSPTL